MGLSRLGILFPFNAYGQEMMALFSDKIEALGANIEIIEFYDQDDTDFKDQLVRIHQISPEALFLPGSYEKIVLIAPQIPFYEPEEADPNDPNYVDPDMNSIFGNEKHSIGFLGSDIDMTKEKKEIQLLGTDGWFDFRLIREGDSYVENAIFSVGFFPESRNLLVAQFVSNFQKRYGEPPDIVSAQAYDATNMLLEASSGGEASWDTIRKNISQIKDFPGVSGRTTIMPSGDSIKEVSLLKVKRRRFVPVERLPFNQNYRPDGWMY
jgi:ABC-type branched-subunit amino acid transport system substrate-binding protein